MMARVFALLAVFGVLAPGRADNLVFNGVRVTAISATLVRIEPKGPAGFEDRTTFMVRIIYCPQEEVACGNPRQRYARMAASFGSYSAWPPGGGGRGGADRGLVRGNSLKQSQSFICFLFGFRAGRREG